MSNNWPIPALNCSAALQFLQQMQQMQYSSIICVIIIESTLDSVFIMYSIINFRPILQCVYVGYSVPHSVYNFCMTDIGYVYYNLHNWNNLQNAYNTIVQCR